MNKTLLFLAVILAVATCNNVEGNIRECAQDIKEAITLAQQIQTDVDARNVTALINDGVAVFNLYERASQDCSFGMEQVETNLVKCVNDVRALLGELRTAQAAFEAQNLTALIDVGVEIYDTVQQLQVDCGNEVSELFTNEIVLKSAVEEFGIVNPIRCVKHARQFYSNFSQFVRAEQNHTLTPEQTFNAIWGLVNDIPIVLTDCGLPVPAFFNNTKALQNCTTAFFQVYEDIVELDNDLNNKDYARVIKDVEGLYQAVQEVQAYCRIENQEEEEEEGVQSLAECVQAIEVFVADVQKLEADDKAHPSDVPLLVADVEAVWYAFEDTLNHCGESQIEQLIEEYVSDECVDDVANLVDKAYEIWEEKDDALAHWRKFAEDVIDFVHDVQQVQDQCVYNPNATLQALPFFFQQEDEIEEYQFNVTECLHQAEVVAADLDSLIADVKSAQTQGFNPVEIESITKDAFTLLDNILYDFVPACAGSEAEDIIDEYLPEACLVAIENASLLVEDIAEHDRDIQYILTSLPQLYEDLVAIGKQCENTIGLFLKPFYKAVDQVRERIVMEN